MPHRYLLVLRFALVNVVAAGLLAAAALQGWLEGIFVEITAELSLGIFAVFLYGLVLCAGKVWRTSVDLNDLRAGTPVPASRAARYLDAVRGGGAEGRSLAAGMLRLKLSNSIVVVRHIANSLVFLGLIGTVIGFIIALSGVDPDAVTEVENVAPMVSTLISGMSVALYTTLIGAVLYVWLIVNQRILVTGTVHLITAIVEEGEARGRA